MTDEPVMSIQINEKHLGLLTEQFKSILYEALNAANSKNTETTSNDTPAQVEPKESKEDKNTLEKEIAKYLSLNSFREAKATEEEIESHFKRQIMAYHLYEFIQSDRFVIHNQNNFYDNDGGPRSERWSKLKLNKELIFDVPWEMCFYLEDKVLDFKFILRIDFAKWRDPGYTLYSTKNDIPKVKQLYKDFQTEYTTKNILKNKNITFIATSSGIAPQLMDLCDVDEDSIFISPENAKEIEVNIINMFKNSHLYKEKNVPCKRGLIFSGPPGCGKTMTIKKIMKNLNEKVTIVNITSKSVSHPSTISSIFEFAKELSPSIVIFEDIDLLGESRDTGSFSAYVGELLAQLDGLEKMENMVVIATTNYPERLDAALSNRPSRFDRHLKFDLPVDQLKLKILENELRNSHVSDDFKVEDFKDQIKNMSGALLKEVAVTSALNSIEDNSPVILKSHIEKAIEMVKKNFTLKKNDNVGF